MLKTADLDYTLPEDLIATAPAQPRDSARLMVLSRSDPARLEHRTIRDLPDLLAPRDCLVFNASWVVPARLEGKRHNTGGRVSGLFLSEWRRPDARGWVCLLKAGGLREGLAIDLDARDSGTPSGLSLRLVERAEGEPGAWRVTLEGPGADEPTPAILDRVGLTPLPPYILQARKKRHADASEADDRRRYQTVYARPQAEPASDQPANPATNPAANPTANPTVSASVAAPTAGLHFTPELLDRLSGRGVARAEVVLHVGSGTFRPVETATVEEHPMHAEWCCIPEPARRAIHAARAAGGRVVCVGTTSARTLESFAALPPGSAPPWLSTRLLITPGYAWRAADALLTNFHLPRSTLMAMVASLLGDAGVPRLLHAYRAAVEHRYRFYSFGDAMLILP